MTDKRKLDDLVGFVGLSVMSLLFLWYSLSGFQKVYSAVVKEGNGLGQVSPEAVFIASGIMAGASVVLMLFAGRYLEKMRWSLDTKKSNDTLRNIVDYPDIEDLEILDRKIATIDYTKNADWFFIQFKQKELEDNDILFEKMRDLVSSQEKISKRMDELYERLKIIDVEGKVHGDDYNKSILDRLNNIYKAVEEKRNKDQES